MPLVHFDNQDRAPFDAVDMRTVTENGNSNHTYVVWTTHHGLCLREREANGYHDSDFFMTYWDYAKMAPVETMFATTRGWCYPCMGSHVDATDEVKALYAAWLEDQRAKARKANRNKTARELVALRNTVRNVFGENYLKAMKLRRKIGDAGFANLLRLMKKRARGNFTKSLQKQVADWMNDPAPKYATPLSAKQLAAIH